MKVLMVCTGNMCRSPLAEEIMRSELKRQGAEEVVVSSAGTGAWEGPRWGSGYEVRSRLIVLPVGYGSGGGHLNYYTKAKRINFDEYSAGNGGHIFMGSG